MKKRVFFSILGSIFLVAGLLSFYITGASILGAAVGVHGVFSYFNIFGSALLIAGLLLLANGTFGEPVKDDDLEATISTIFHKLDGQRKEHPANPNFLEGLDTIKEIVLRERRRFYEERGEGSKAKSVRRTIKERVGEWITALDRREDWFFNLPRHAGREGRGEYLSRPWVRTMHDEEQDTRRAAEYARDEPVERGYHVRNRKGKVARKNLPDTIVKDRLTKGEVFDVPDWGLYAYDSMIRRGARGRKMVELDVFHYTENDARKAIEHKYRNAKRDSDKVFMTDKTGWAYFVDHRLPEKLFTLAGLRTLIGTGHQDYVGRHARADPQACLHLTIRVPQERVFVKETLYDSRGNVVKYDDDHSPVDAVDLRFFEAYQKKGAAGAGKDMRSKRRSFSVDHWKRLEEIHDGLSRDEYFLVKKYAVAGGISAQDIVDDDALESVDIQQVWSKKSGYVEKKNVIERGKRK